MGCVPPEAVPPAKPGVHAANLPVARVGAGMPRHLRSLRRHDTRRPCDAGAMVRRPQGASRAAGAGAGWSPVAARPGRQITSWPAEVPRMHARRPVSRSLVRILVVAGAVGVLLAGAAPATAADPDTYRNPLEPVVPGDGSVESCADPSVIRGQEGEGRWYLYCTSDPLNDDDRTDEGFRFRLIPMLTSRDLVHWRYRGDAFESRPAWASPTAGLWAPEIEYDADRGRYLLYVTVTETTLPGGGSAIGVATSDGPLGPWTWADDPVVEPHAPDCCPADRRWVFDPEVLQTRDGRAFIYYGSYFGGISVRRLSDDLLHADPASQRNVAIANKYEGAEVVERNGWYYLFVSATDCCRGPLSGYAVFVGRSERPTGPFRDRSGVSLNDNEVPEDPTDGRAGGTPVLYGNDRPWVGTGHNTVFRDFDGQWWTIYHAIHRNEPYFEGGVNLFGEGDLNKRPILMDAIDWVDGWPVVNAGRGPSTTTRPAPAAQPEDDPRDQPADGTRFDRPGRLLLGRSDTFAGPSLDDRWSWVREPAADTWRVSGGALRWQTQAGDLFEGSNTASVLTRRLPAGDWVAQTRVRLNVPAEGCCFNYVQAGLVVYDDDDNFLKLASVSIFNTRQTEWAKERFPVAEGYPRYGNSIVGPPGGFRVTDPTRSTLGRWTDLRIVHREHRGEDSYTAYTRAANGRWERGMTWRHDLGGARLGLVAMGGSGFTATFEEVKVWRLRDR
jgi:arabinan endo-1,5-alpha-L-arabinosidase